MENILINITSKPKRQKIICHYIDKQQINKLKLMRVVENYYVHPDCESALVQVIKTECIRTYSINDSHLAGFSASKLLEFAQDNINNSFNNNVNNSFKVFEKGNFYDADKDEYVYERELIDGDCVRCVMLRNNDIMVIEEATYGLCEFHIIEKDNDDKYRVER